MPKRRPAKDKVRQTQAHEAKSFNVLQSYKNHNGSANTSDSQTYISEDISNVKAILDDEVLEPGTSHGKSLTQSTAALHDELDSFRQRWKRELEIKKPQDDEHIKPKRLEDTIYVDDSKENKHKSRSSNLKHDSNSSPKEIYALAKKLFLMGVDLEQDEMHHESISYYKQAMHLCPDIEKQIYREQCEASLRSSAEHRNGTVISTNDVQTKIENEVPILERIKEAFHVDRTNNRHAYCRPAIKLKSGVRHISDLPRDLILQIFRYVICKELDLASLESLGSVCRGFHILSNDSSLWRSICYTTWSENELEKNVKISRPISVNWKQIYMTKPRVNFNGVYMSRTKYIRQGDVGFQDITYRPFHIVRYYRYLRFFPDRRVLILTTNEEPDKIVPIFRHALHSKQFSPELSILDGTYELINTDELTVSAEKDSTIEHDQAQLQTFNRRRQARFHWSRQTPVWQRFNMRFKLKTIENRSCKNNVLKWLEYSILSKTEMGQELTEFDMSPDTFPILTFSSVKSFNLRLTEPLPSH